MELKDIDLNLLIVFEQVMAARSVSKAADALDLTQSAVSNALNRLRRLLRDDLFVRTPRGMEPTPLADALAAPVAHALKTVHDAIHLNLAFVPVQSTRQFALALTDFAESLYLPGLMQTLAHEAPGISVSTRRCKPRELHNLMHSGEVDLAVGLLPQLREGFFQRSLGHYRYVCLCRQEHPLAQGPLTLARYAAARHLVMLPDEAVHQQLDELLVEQGIHRTVYLRVPHFTTVGPVLQGSDLIATLPDIVAAHLAGLFGLAMVELSANLPDIPISVLWHARYHRDPGNQWLRTAIATIAASTASSRQRA